MRWEEELCVAQVIEKSVAEVDQNPAFLPTDVHAPFPEDVLPSLLPT